MAPRLPILSCALLLLLAHCEMRDRPLADATGLFDRGVSLFEEKAYASAESLFVQSLPEFERVGQTYTIAEANRYLGRIYQEEGRYATALRRFQTALRLTQSAKDFRSEMSTHALLGDTYKFLGMYQSAMASYKEARRLSLAFNDLETKASLEQRMGEIARITGHLDDAFSLDQSAFTYYQTQGGSAAAEALRGLGEVLFLQNKFDAAQTSLTQARTMVQRSSGTILDAKLRLDLGLVQKAQGKYNEALQWFRDAVNELRSRQAGKEPEVPLLFNIGYMYLENSQFADAKRYFAEAESEAREIGDGIAEGYLALFGVRCDEQSLNANQKIQQNGRLVAAYEGVIQKFQAAGYRSGEAYSHAQVGRLYESVGNLPRAREEYREAIELEEATFGEFVIPEVHHFYLDALNMDAERVRWYAQLAGILIQLNAREEALAALELGSQRRMSMVLRDVDIGIRNRGLKQDMGQARSVSRELRMLQVEQSSLLGIRRGRTDDRLVNGLHSQISSLQRELSTLSTRAGGQYPNYEPLLQSGPARIKDIQASIPPGTLILRFLPSNNQLHVFALTRTKLEVRSSIVTREKLLSMVAEYERLLNDPSVYTGSAGETSVTTMTRFATLSTQLYDYLIRPIDPLMERNLVIIAGKEFEGFPFQTIERQDRGGSVRYLIEITSVDYLPSLASVRYKTAEGQRINQIVALGNPTGKNWSIDYELRDVRSFFKDAAIFIGRDATWENLKAAKADVLQISSDFLLGEGDSPLGVIALAKAGTPDDIEKIPFEKLTGLQAPPLILLSNQYGQGTGLSTMHALVLRMNGTSDIFFNAWYSDRKAAKFFSEFFYTHLANGLAPGDAYRQALLNLIRTRDVSHPHSWGQFFHFGLG